MSTLPTTAAKPGVTQSDFADRPLWKVILLFPAPMLLSNNLQSLSGTLNNIYVSQMHGVSALAAVSSFFPVVFFSIALVMGLGAV